MGSKYNFGTFQENQSVKTDAGEQRYRDIEKEEHRELMKI